ncbi:MAG TPA: ABC transporter ATP-binding protein [Opitutaceae bacterium]
MATPSPIVEFCDVAKRYGDGPRVLDGITLAAQPGDFIALIGPSGCGKSTLLKLISALSPVTSGALRVGGHPPEVASKELAYVFQEPTLLPWATVALNVEMLLRLRGTPGPERHAARERALQLVRLTDKVDQYPRQLSGGQKMRVSIARALTLSPKIMLLDEPFGALDEMTRDHLNEELLAIREQQAWTAFFVTHSVAEAVFLSNRVVIMAANPGRIHREVRVDLPYPRTADTRRAPAYQQLVAEVSQVLRSVENDAP